MKNLYQDTIVAPATTPGTGAISIIRISGPDAFRIADEVVKIKSGTISQAKSYTIHFGEIYSDGQLLDEVLTSVFRAPRSYTGEDSVEISSHASSYIVEEILRLLTSAGARMAEPGEFTRRAFVNGKMDLSQAEAVADVISSATEASHRVAMNQLRGGYSGELERLRAGLLETASLLELELDFAEEEVEFASRERLRALLEECISHVGTLAASFRRGNMIKDGVPVAIVGSVNAGKSTLLNALLGEDRAIVSDVAGTTRDTVEEPLDIGGILFRFIDTAGLRDSEDAVENMGIERTKKKLSQAEAVLGVLDCGASLESVESSAKEVFGMADSGSQKLFFLLNKIDLLSENDINKIVTIINNNVLSVDNKCVILKISAKHKIGLEELKNALLEAEKDLIPNAGVTLVTNLRHYEALSRALDALRDCRTSLSRGVPSDLVAEDLRRAVSSVGAILGKDLLDPDTVLHTIFAKHCIGK